MNAVAIFYKTILCILVLYVIFILLYYSFNKDIAENNRILEEKLANHRIGSLLNGSGINNIPGLNIITTNTQVQIANACGKGPVYVGEKASDSDCKKTCADPNAFAINVDSEETYIYESSVLKAGAHCAIGPKPYCNMRTTYALMTISSVTCRSRFPDVIGGTLGNNVIACNNRQINDPQNYLWDNLKRKKFDPLTTIFTDVDEMMPDGKQFRFECMFCGVDVRRNRYMQHPFNRFHPIRNYCASQIFAASEQVKTQFFPDGSYVCNCGKPEDTRVINDADISTACAPFHTMLEHDVQERYKLTVSVPCFNIFSPLEYVGSRIPCPGNEFRREGSERIKVEIPVTYGNTTVPIEHPIYDNKNVHFSSAGTKIGSGRLPYKR